MVDRLLSLFSKAWDKKETDRKVVGLLFKKWRGLGFTKRTKFIASSLFFSLGLILTSIFTRGRITFSVATLAVLNLILIYGSLAKELAGIRFFLLPILPVGFTIFTTPFYFFLELGWPGKFLNLFLYGISFYLIMLIVNIYNISARRAIPLLHAAQAVGFLFTLVSTFAAYSLIFLFGLLFWQNAALVGLVSFPFILFSLWSVRLAPKIEKKIWLYTATLSLLLAQIALVLSFWPVGPMMVALFLASFFYALVEVVQLYLANRLTLKLALEYFGIGIAVLFLLTISARW